MATLGAADSAWKEALAAAWRRHRCCDYLEAERLYRRVLTERPLHFDALHMLGVVAVQTRRPDEAVIWLTEAVRQRPTSSAAQANLALALVESNRLAEAVEAYARLAALRPTEAEPAIHLAATLGRVGRFDEALGLCDRLVERLPALAEAHLARAVALKDLLRLEESLAACEKAVALHPASALAWDKRAAVLRDLARLDEARHSLERARTADPGYVLAEEHAGMLDLLDGNFARGWELYEARTRPGGSVGPRCSDRPRWPGSHGREDESILVTAEQGLGDTLQFCRYLPLVAARGLEVVFRVQPGLAPLMRSLGSGIAVVSEGSAPPRDTSWHCPLMSLPRAFGTRLDDVPSETPYLKAEPARVRRWRALLGTHGVKVGICWQGSVGPVDAGRSIPLGLLAPLATLPGVRLISLQKGPGCAQLASLRGACIEQLPGDWDQGGAAFLDSAAIMMSLDLIISVDTSIAHLAGALGRPVWLLLKQVPDWRWLLAREDTPWYPSIRLFRQRQMGRWTDVIERAQAELRRLLAVRSGLPAAPPALA